MKKHRGNRNKKRGERLRNLREWDARITDLTMGFMSARLPGLFGMLGRMLGAIAP